MQLSDDTDFLDYAAPKANNDLLPTFRITLGVLALFAVFANAAFIALTVSQFHRTSWLYHDLKQDPKALGRFIDSATVQLLSDRSHL